MPDTMLYLLSSVSEGDGSATPHAVYVSAAAAAFDCAQEQAGGSSRLFGVLPLPLFVKEFPDA
jgi:hypothetical protein